MLEHHTQRTLRALVFSSKNILNKASFLLETYYYLIQQQQETCKQSLVIEYFIWYNAITSAKGKKLSIFHP